MTRFETAALAATALLSIGGATAAQAQAQPAPVLFDDFLFDNLGQPGENLNDFIQWNVTGGSVDLVGGNVPGAPLAPPANPLGRYVDLGGSTGNPGQFQTKIAIPTTAASSYTLTFAYRSDTPGQFNAATVSAGGFSFDFGTASEAFTQFSRTFTFDPLISSAFVTFQGLETDTDNSGVGIDLVQFGPTLVAAGAVPEPSTWALMILGVGMTGAAMRRRAGRRAIA